MEREETRREEKDVFGEGGEGNVPIQRSDQPGISRKSMGASDFCPEMRGLLRCFMRGVFPCAGMDCMGKRTCLPHRESEGVCGKRTGVNRKGSDDHVVTPGNFWSG